MIAIPVDTTTTDARSSKLFGNVSAFALYKDGEEAFRFVDNAGKGDGVATAKMLSDLDVTSVVYSFMGNGPFSALDEEGIGIYYLGKEPLELDAIVKGIDAGTFVKVDAKNADTYLDPGNATGSCACGSSHG